MKQQEKKQDRPVPPIDVRGTEEEMIRVVVIENDQGTIKDVPRGQILASFQKIVGGNVEYVAGLRECIGFYINEEGKNLNLPLNRLGTILAEGAIMPGDFIAGPMIVSGVDERGNDCSLPEEIVKTLSSLTL